MKAWIYIVTLLSGLASCTSLSEGGAPGQIPNPDHDRRVLHTGNNLDHARQQMDRQSSVINRKHNIEESHQGPATTPTRHRPKHVPNAPVDSARHQVQWPLRNRVN